MANTLGKYTLIRKLATGGMAEVFLARAEGPMGFQKRLVVKRILPHFSDDPQFVQMFLGEARLAAELNHPNLVQIFDFGNVDGQYFIAMEYIEGPNLRVLNKAAREHFGPIPLPIAARIIALAAEGLHHAHELRDDAGRPVQLVHRDISPDNILVSRTGSVKVVDFGIAKAANQPHLTKSGMIKGKMAYMPPEQLAREPLDRRVDVFALGVVLYELVCGAMPFDATSEVSIIQAIMGQQPLGRVREKRQDVPKKLDDIIAKCLEKTPANRYATARDLQLDLERFLQSTGEVTGTADLAALIEKLFPSDWEATNPSTRASVSGSANPVDAEGALEQTAQRKSTKESEAPAKTQAGEPTGMSGTALRHVPAKKNGALYAAVGGGALAIVALGAYLALRPPAVVEKPVTTGHDAGAVAVVVDAGAPAIVAAEPVDAGAEAEAVDAGAIAEVADAGAVKSPVAARGKLELRIRPYAIVFIDGKEIGDTPLPPQALSAGHHKVRLVNKNLGKDVALDVTVKPGETTILKHNLKE